MPLLSCVLEEPAAQQDALEVRRRHRVAERGRVQIAQLRHREGRRREREAEVRIRELAAQALAGGHQDRLVVVRERRQLVERVPARVRRQRRVGVARDEPEERGRELPVRRVPPGVAARLQLLEVRHLPDVDLGREVSAHRLLQRLVRLQGAAGKRPEPGVRLAGALPQERLQTAVPHLEDGCENRVRGCFRSGVGNRVHSPIGYRL